MPGLLLLTFCFVLMQYECENVLNDAALMEACGVGLSRTDMYGVMMVCKQLGEDPKLGVATVRFFGKVVIQDTSSIDRQLSCTCLLFGVWYLPSQFFTYPISRSTALLTRQDPISFGPPLACEFPICRLEFSDFAAGCPKRQ